MGNLQTTTSSEVTLKAAQVVLLGDDYGTAWLLRRLGALQSFISVPLAHKVKICVEDPKGHTSPASITLKIRNTSELRFYHLPIIYRAAEAAIIVYDVTNKELYNLVRLWVKELKVKGRHDIVVILIGYNKADCDKKPVSIEAMNTYSKEKGVLLHADLNTECHIMKLSEVLIEMTRAVIAVRSYREKRMKLPERKGVFPSSFVELDRTLKITSLKL